MLTTTLTELFERDLQKLVAEINLYEKEESLWLTKEGIANSAGNLCLHLAGNLNHFIGATLGNTGYIRKRDEEFSLKNITRRALISSLEECVVTIKTTLDKLTNVDLEKDYPLLIFGTPFSCMQMLVHLYGHLNYHLGQINYHRRLIS